MSSPELVDRALRALRPDLSRRQRREARRYLANVGESWREIRDGRLYEADGFETFEAYMAERFSVTVAEAEAVIGVARRHGKRRR